MGAPVRAREDFDCAHGPVLLLIIEEEGFRRNVRCQCHRQRSDFSGRRRLVTPANWRLKATKPHRCVRLDNAAIDLNTSHRRSVRTPRNAGNSPCAELGAISSRGAHDSGGEFARVNNRRGVRPAELYRD